MRRCLCIFLLGLGVVVVAGGTFLFPTALSPLFLGWLIGGIGIWFWTTTPD